MEISKYNVVYSDDQKVVIFNALTSALIKILPTEWDLIRRCQWNEINNRVIEQLLQMGIISEDHESQIVQFKYRFYKLAFEAHIPFLYIAPTMRCNFDCFYCFEQGNKHQGLMTEEVADKIVRFLKAHNKNEVSIVWFGGEPMLGFDRIQYICQQLNKEDIAFSSLMITNGSLFTESNTKLLSQLNLKFIQISMDGVNETHDRRRCFIGGAGSFDIVIKNLERILTQTEIPVVIQITMDHLNPTAYEDMREYCSKSFSQYLTSGRLQIGYNNVQNRTGFDTIGSCFSSEDLISEEILRIKDSSSIRLPSLFNPCMYRASWYYAIDPVGNLYKCIEQLGNPEERVGSLEDDFMSLKRLGLSAFREDAFNDPECQKCSIFPICGGGCPLDRIKRAKGENREVCSKYKNRLHTMLPVIYERLHHDQI